MRVDHLSFAAGPDGLAATANRIGHALGGDFTDGGFHPRFGTRNMIMALTHGQYLEVVEVLDHPAADKAPFGQAVRARSAEGGGWLAWVIAVDDLAPVEQRLGREAVDGSRHRPDGQQLSWRQIGIKGLQNDPQLPFFVKWTSDPALHPSNEAATVTLTGLEIAGDSTVVEDWLGGKQDVVLPEVDLTWVDGTPGLAAAAFATPAGPVRL